MRRATSPVGSAGFGAAHLAATAIGAWLLVACAAGSRVPTAAPSVARPSVAAPEGLPTSAPIPSSPTEFTLHDVAGAFASVTALTSTGDHLYWGTEATIWRFAPGDSDPTPVYVSPAKGALVWDVAATDTALVFSELLASPRGGWRVAYVARDGAAPVELDRGIAERGTPPTLAINSRRIAWAGFDESSAAPRSFLRSVDRTSPDTPTTLLDLDIDDGLLWFPQLDRDTLWYGTIKPDFAGTGGGDDISIGTIDLATPSAGPARFVGGDSTFNPAVSPDYLVWKSLEPGFAALTWGQLHALDRASDERFVIADQANNPSLGSRFVAFEEISHGKLLLYDLATRTLMEIPDPMDGADGTVGPVAISGNLLGYGTSAKGSKTVSWTILPG